VASSLVRAAWLLPFAIALGACAGGGSSTEGSPARDSGALPTPAHERLDCDLPAVIEYCGGSTCHYDHAAPDLASSLVLWDRQASRMPDDVHTRLVAVAATYHNVQDPERCPSEPELLIDPSNIELSLIFRKLTGTQQCGAEMPKFPYPEWGTVANPGAQRAVLMQCLRDWVALLVEDYKQAP
jgi:hypothetical protein